MKKKICKHISKCACIKELHRNLLSSKFRHFDKKLLSIADLCLDQTQKIPFDMGNAIT